MPVERKDPDRVRLMDAYLKEVQAFAIKLRLGVISREEWREWLRQEYNVPLAPPIKLDGDGVPDMSDVAGLPDYVSSLVDDRLAEMFVPDEGADGRPESIVQAEQGDGELDDDELQRLVEEGA